MNIVTVKDYTALSEKAARFVADRVNGKKELVLGLPTGSTPEGMYAKLVKLYREQKVDFSEVVSFNLDEYCGLRSDHPQSYHYYMNRNFFDHVNISEENRHIPIHSEYYEDESCSRYDQLIDRAGGIDLQVLGIGTNGHIAFNEPADYLIGGTHLVQLSEKTIEANSRFFNSRAEVPRRAITMGMATIMHAAEILLLAAGKNKARAIEKACSGVITTQLPASLLQLHNNCTLLLDREAASLL